MKTTILRDIERLCDSNIDNWNQSTVLMLAATSGNKIMIFDILESLSNENEKPLEEKCDYVQNLILTAKNKNNFDLVAFELSKQNTYNSDIIMGIKKGKDVSKERKNQDSNVESLNGNNALMIACYYGHLDAVKLLVTPDGLHDTCDFNNSCLHLAVEGDHLEIVKYLVDYDESLLKELEEKDALRQSDAVNKCLDLKTKSPSSSKSPARFSQPPGSEPLSINLPSFKEDDVDKICLLNQKNKENKTPLLLACELGSFQVARWFLKEKASYFNLNEASVKVNSDGISKEHMNCVTYACKGTANHDKILDLLLQEGAEVNIRVGETTPLCFASKTGAINAIKLILDSPQGRMEPITINYRNSLGYTPLMRAAEAGQLEIAKYLIERGAAKWLYNPPFIIDEKEITEPGGENHEDNTKPVNQRKSNFEYHEGNNETTALSLALRNVHIDLATECFMTDINNMGEHVSMLDVSFEECHLDDQTKACLFSEKLV